VFIIFMVVTSVQKLRHGLCGRELGARCRNIPDWSRVQTARAARHMVNTDAGPMSAPCPASPAAAACETSWTGVDLAQRAPDRDRLPWRCWNSNRGGF